VVDSPQKKKSASLEDCVRDISDTVKEMASGGQQLSREEKEMDQVRQILEQDGFPEGTEEFLKATYLLKALVWFWEIDETLSANLVYQVIMR